MDFAIALDNHSPMPLHQQLYEALRQGILTGRLTARQRLPSTRALAKTLSISRSTVTQTYDQLLSEGYLQTIVGSGTYVCDQLPDELLCSQSVKAKPPVSSAAIRLSQYGASLTGIEHPTSTEPTTPISFRYGRPALDLFPLEQWRKLLSRHCRSGSDWLDYATDPMGYRPLREAIARYLAQARAVHCDPDQILITNGTQQAVYLIARLLLEPGDRVAIENPGYLSARRILQTQGAKLLPISVDQAGLKVDELEVTEAIRLVYVTPSHQFPTGAVLSLPRRLALLAWAQQTGSLIIEDDYDSEYRYSGRPIPALQGLAAGHSVLYAGTFSKVLFPSLRMGYLVLPPALVSVFGRAKWLMDRQIPALEQRVLADFITEGHLERHIRRMRSHYDQRRQVLVQILNQCFGSDITILGENAGLHLMVRFQTDLNDEEFMARATQAGVGLISAQPQYLTGSNGHEFIFSYTELDEANIREGIDRIAQILQSAAGKA